MHRIYKNFKIFLLPYLLKLRSLQERLVARANHAQWSSTTVRPLPALLAGPTVGRLCVRLAGARPLPDAGPDLRPEVFAAFQPA
jgi:hypothetical protein